MQLERFHILGKEADVIHYVSCFSPWFCFLTEILFKQVRCYLLCPCEWDHYHNHLFWSPYQNHIQVIGKILPAQEVDAGRSGIQGDPQLHSKLEVSLGYLHKNLSQKMKN